MSTSGLQLSSFQPSSAIVSSTRVGETPRRRPFMVTVADALGIPYPRLYYLTVTRGKSSIIRQLRAVGRDDLAQKFKRRSKKQKYRNGEVVKAGIALGVSRETIRQRIMTQDGREGVAAHLRARGRDDLARAFDPGTTP